MSNNATTTSPEDSSDSTVLYLAVFIPTAAFILLVVLIAFWLYIKSKAPKKPLMLKSLRHVPKSEHYQTFNNPAILDEYIRRNTVSARYSYMDSRDPSPVPLPDSLRISEHNASRPVSVSPNTVKPFIIPVRLPDDLQDDSVHTSSGQNMENTRSLLKPSGSVRPDSSQSSTKRTKSNAESNISEASNGAVVIHVDNINRLRLPRSH